MKLNQHLILSLELFTKDYKHINFPKIEGDKFLNDNKWSRNSIS